MGCRYVGMEGLVAAVGLVLELRRFVEGVCMI